MASISAFRMEKLITSLFARSTPKIGHLLLLDFGISWRSNGNVLLCRLVMSLAVYRHPQSMCVLVSGDWHLVYLWDGPYFFFGICGCDASSDF